MDLDSARAMNIYHSTVCITAPRVSRLNPLGADIAPKPAKLTLCTHTFRKMNCCPSGVLPENVTT